jgi:hypothetical protein
MCEGLVRPLRVMVGLAQGELDMKSIIILKAGITQRRIHCGNVCILEPHRLEVREAPPRFPQGRLELDRPSIGHDAFVRPADGLQHMAVTHPDARAHRRLPKNLFVQFERLIELAEASQSRSLEVRVAELVRLVPEQIVQQFQGLRGTT